MQKKGVIELHFNWIFVLIAGAVIFFFFINVVNRQKDFSEIKISSTIINNLESILAGAQVSTNTVNIIEVPKVKIGVECDKFFIGNVPKQTKGNIIFSPNLLKGKEIITWTLEWSLPYRVTNFLYITDPEVRYIIVNNSENLGRKIYDELPKEVNKELVTSPSEAKDKNNYKVKFIFINNLNDDFLVNLEGMPDQDVRAINLKNIGSSDIIENTGAIEFWKKDGSQWTQETGETFYLKKESLFGAIFAEDLETYNCLMRKAFKKLNLITKVYLERCDRLSNYYGFEDPCNVPHTSVKTELSNMEIRSGEELNDFPADFPANGLGRMDEMMGYSNMIKDKNQRAQLFSCALIY